MNIFRGAMFLLLLIMSGCSAYKGINLFRLEIGMTKNQVVTALDKYPDNLIGAKKYRDGKIEVLQYSKYGFYYGNLQERYWLYFFNNELIQWGRPGDWQKEADRIYEIRHR